MLCYRDVLHAVKHFKAMKFKASELYPALVSSEHQKRTRKITFFALKSLEETQGVFFKQGGVEGN